MQPAELASLVAGIGAIRFGCRATKFAPTWTSQGGKQKQRRGFSCIFWFPNLLPPGRARVESGTRCDRKRLAFHLVWMEATFGNQRTNILPNIQSSFPPGLVPVEANLETSKRPHTHVNRLAFHRGSSRWKQIWSRDFRASFRGTWLPLRQTRGDAVSQSTRPFLAKR
jgi:hypothetical protein